LEAVVDESVILPVPQKTPEVEPFAEITGAVGTI
jgi:hypothetical protein